MAIRHIDSTAFAISFALLSLYVLAQQLRAWRAEGARNACCGSYRALMHGLLLAWSVCRALFWAAFALDAPLRPRELYFLVFFGGDCLQLLAFGELAVFLTKVARRGAWRSGLRPRAFAALAALVVVAAAGTVTFATLAARGDPDAGADADSAESAARGFALGGALLYLAVGLTFALLALALSRVPSDEFSRMLLFKPRMVSSVAGVVGAVLLTRSVFCFLVFARVLDIDITLDDPATDATWAVAYAVFEFFPVLLLLLTLAAGAPRGRAYGDLAGGDFGVFGAIAAGAALQQSEHGTASASASSSSASMTQLQQQQQALLEGMGPGGGGTADGGGGGGEAGALPPFYAAASYAVSSAASFGGAVVVGNGRRASDAFDEFSSSGFVGGGIGAGPGGGAGAGTGGGPASQPLARGLPSSSSFLSLVGLGGSSSSAFLSSLHSADGGGVGGGGSTGAGVGGTAGGAGGAGGPGGSAAGVAMSSFSTPRRQETDPSLRGLGASGGLVATGRLLQQQQRYDFTLSAMRSPAGVGSLRANGSLTTFAAPVERLIEQQEEDERDVAPLR